MSDKVHLLPLIPGLDLGTCKQEVVSLPEKRNSLSLGGPIESPGFCLDCWSAHLFRWEGIHDAVILAPLVRRKSQILLVIFNNVRLLVPPF